MSSQACTIWMSPGVCFPCMQSGELLHLKSMLAPPSRFLAQTLSSSVLKFLESHEAIECYVAPRIKPLPAIASRHKPILQHLYSPCMPQIHLYHSRQNVYMHCLSHALCNTSVSACCDPTAALSSTRRASRFRSR